MVNATSDGKFKQELTTIDQCQTVQICCVHNITFLLPGFQVLSEPEKNASVHSLLKHCSQDQLRFLQSIVTSMIEPEETRVTPGKVLSMDANIWLIVS